MKNKLFAFLATLLVVFSLTLTACNKNTQDKQDPVDSGSTVTSESNLPKLIDRSNYTYDNLVGSIKDYKLASENVKFYDYCGEVISDYKVGDIFNIMLTLYDQKLSIGSNLAQAFGYSLYEDGWRTNVSKTKVHSLINAIFDLNLTPDSKLVVNDFQLETYKNTKLYTLLGYSDSVKDTLGAINPSLDALLGETYGNIYNLINGKGADKINAQKAVLSKVKMADILSIFTDEKVDLDTNLYEFVFENKIMDMYSVYEILSKNEVDRQIAIAEIVTKYIFESILDLDNLYGDEILFEDKVFNDVFSYILRYLSANDDEKLILENDVLNFVSNSTFGDLVSIVKTAINNNPNIYDEILKKYNLEFTGQDILLFLDSEFFVKNENTVVGDYQEKTIFGDFLNEFITDNDIKNSQAYQNLLQNFGEKTLLDMSDLTPLEQENLKDILSKIILNEILK